MGDPGSYVATASLLDGRPVNIRAIRPDDKAALRAGMRRLSARSAYLRFFNAKRELSDAELVRFTELDFRDHVGLVALVEEAEGDRAVGVGRYIRVAPGATSAEVAFAVDDAHQGLGIGTILLEHLARIAREQGVAELTASVLAENRKMLEVFAHADLEAEKRFESGVWEISLRL